MKAALVDIGNVLLKLRRNPMDFLVPDGAGEVLREAFLQLYCCFESGVVSEQEFVSRAMSITGFQGSPVEFESAWCDIFDPMTEMWEWCERKKAEGMKLVLFSNTNTLHLARFLKEPIFSQFDAAIYSFEIGEMKPGDGMYEYAVGKLGLNPSETVYVDDLEQNIETGQRFGFRCSQFFPGDPVGSVARLDDLCR